MVKWIIGFDKLVEHSSETCICLGVRPIQIIWFSIELEDIKR